MWVSGSGPRKATLFDAYRFGGHLYAAASRDRLCRARQRQFTSFGPIFWCLVEPTRAPMGAREYEVVAVPGGNSTFGKGAQRSLGKARRSSQFRKFCQPKG